MSPSVFESPASCHPVPRGCTQEPGTPGSAVPHSTILDSHCLLQGAREVLIQHQGQLYRLQATRQGKLILTK